MTAKQCLLELKELVKLTPEDVCKHGFYYKYCVSCPASKAILVDLALMALEETTEGECKKCGNTPYSTCGCGT